MVAKWPAWVSVGAVIGTVLVALLALFSERIGKQFGGKAERFLAGDHDTKLRALCQGTLWLFAGASAISIAFGAGQWGWAGLTISVGGVVCYWGTKVCVRRSSKRAAAAIGIGAYLISISANFVAGAIAGDVSIESSLEGLGKGIATLAKGQATIVSSQQGLQRTQEEIRQGQNRIEIGQTGIVIGIDELRQNQQIVLAYIEKLSIASISGAREDVPKHVMDAAKVLAASNSARDRVLAATIRGSRGGTVERDLEDLRNSPVVDIAYENEMTIGDYFSSLDEPDKAVVAYARAIGFKPNDFRAGFAHASSITSSSKHSDTQNLTRVVDFCNRALNLDLSDIQKARLKRVLGRALQNMPSGNRSTNRILAMQRLEESLSLCRSAQNSEEWVYTQVAIGTLWLEMPTYAGWQDVSVGEMIQPERAIDAFEMALKEFKREANPIMWACVQNNMGNALALLTETGVSCTNESLAHYQNALLEIRRENRPLFWAGIQHNLGNRWAQRLDGDRKANIFIAVTHYMMALQVRGKEDAPALWADTQFAIGQCYAGLHARTSETDRREYLVKAISALKAARLGYSRAEWNDKAGRALESLGHLQMRYESEGYQSGPTGVAFDAIHASK